MMIPLYRSWCPSSISSFPIPCYTFEPMESAEPGETPFFPHGFPGSGDEPLTYLEVPDGSELLMRPDPDEDEDEDEDDEFLMLILPTGEELDGIDAFDRFADPETKRSHNQAIRMMLDSTHPSPQVN